MHTIKTTKTKAIVLEYFICKIISFAKIIVFSNNQFIAKVDYPCEMIKD